MKSSSRNLPFILFGCCMLTASEDGVVPKASDDADSPRIEIIEDAPSAAYKDALMEAVHVYWEAKLRGDLAGAYDLYLPQYKEAVSFGSFQNQKRAIVQGFTITSATFWKDSCALVRLRLHLKTEVMELKSAPARQQWLFQDGKWLLFENPTQNSMFRSRKGRTLTSPCEPVPRPKRAETAPAKTKDN